MTQDQTRTGHDPLTTRDPRPTTDDQRLTINDQRLTTNDQRSTRFTRAERVRKRAEYQRIYDRGVKVNSRAFTLFRFSNGLEFGRLGIAATRKLGGAVVRNRAKRLVREVFRRNKLAPGFDIVIVPRRELLDTSLVALEREFRNSLERSARRAR